MERRVSTAARTDSNVTADKSVSAGFAINTYQLHYAVGADGGGTVSGVTSQTVNHGGRRYGRHCGPERRAPLCRLERRRPDGRED